VKNARKGVEENRLHRRLGRDGGVFRSTGGEQRGCPSGTKMEYGVERKLKEGGDIVQRRRERSRRWEESAG